MEFIKNRSTWYFMTTLDRPNFLSTPFLFPGMIVSISRSRILGLSFFHSLPVPEFREWIFLFHSCAQILGRLFFSFCIFHSPIMHSRSPLEWLVLLTLFSPSRPPLFPKMLRKTGKEQGQVSLSIFFVVISPQQMSKEETFNHQQCEMWNLRSLFTKYVGAGLTCNFQTWRSGPLHLHLNPVFLSGALFHAWN